MGSTEGANNAPRLPQREEELQRQRASAMAEFLQSATLAPIRKLNG